MYLSCILLECRCFPSVAHGMGNWPEPELGAVIQPWRGHQPIRGEYCKRGPITGQDTDGGSHRPVWSRSKGIDPSVDQYLDIWDLVASAVPSYGRSSKQCSCAETDFWMMMTVDVSHPYFLMLSWWHWKTLRYSDFQTHRQSDIPGSLLWPTVTSDMCDICANWSDYMM